jgi:hypothetical protein
MRKLSLAISALFVLTPAGILQAEGIVDGQILRYTTGAQGQQEYLLVYMSGISGAPTCSTASRFIMSSTAPNYRSTVATVIAAYHAGATVTARGLGTCNFWANTEDLSYVCPGTGC